MLHAHWLETPCLCSQSRISHGHVHILLAVKGGKLEALEYVRTLFSVPRERCVAAGDSGNDILMLEGMAVLPLVLINSSVVHSVSVVQACKYLQVRTRQLW